MCRLSNIQRGYFLSQNLSANLGTKNTRTSKSKGNSLRNLKSGKKKRTQIIQVLGQKIPKTKIVKIKIHVAQNVGKVWISRKKNFPASFHAISGHISHGPKKPECCQTKILGGPMGVPVSIAGLCEPDG